MMQKTLAVVCLANAPNCLDNRYVRDVNLLSSSLARHFFSEASDSHVFFIEHLVALFADVREIGLPIALLCRGDPVD
jgi:hypothetical protein